MTGVQTCALPISIIRCTSSIALPADGLIALTTIGPMVRFGTNAPSITSTCKQQYPWMDAQEHVKRLHQSFGPQRLMWATDWPVCLPHATYEQTLKVVRDDMKFLNDDDKSWMLSKTIERVWPFS